MKNSYRLIISILLLITIISCQKQKYTQISKGKYTIEEMKELLPPEVTVERMDDDKYIVISLLKRTDSNHRNKPKISVSSNTVAISYPSLPTVIDDKKLFEGRIDIYEYENNNFKLKDNIYSPITKNYIDNGKYLDVGNDMRNLSELKLYGDYLLVDGGGYTYPRKMPQYDNIKSSDELFKLIKKNDEVYDKVYLYKRTDNKWKLHQEFSADLGNNSNALHITEEGIGFKPNPFFGQSLDINDNCCFIYDNQLHNMLYFYKKDIKGKFIKVAEYPINVAVNTSISKLYSIFTKGYGVENSTVIINNDTTKIETTINSPLYPNNVSIGTSVMVVDDLAFIGEAYYGFQSQDIDALEEKFPGYVHIYKRGSDKTWGVSITLCKLSLT